VIKINGQTIEQVDDAPAGLTHGSIGKRGNTQLLVGSACDAFFVRRGMSPRLYDFRGIAATECAARKGARK
jgi:hypothetical protein